jgi:hypothetical protein
MVLDFSKTFNSRVIYMIEDKLTVNCSQDQNKFGYLLIEVKISY